MCRQIFQSAFFIALGVLLEVWLWSKWAHLCWYATKQSIYEPKLYCHWFAFKLFNSFLVLTFKTIFNIFIFHHLINLMIFKHLILHFKNCLFIIYESKFKSFKQNYIARENTYSKNIFFKYPSFFLSKWLFPSSNGWMFIYKCIELRLDQLTDFIKCALPLKMLIFMHTYIKPRQFSPYNYLSLHEKNSQVTKERSLCKNINRTPRSRKGCQPALYQ